MLNKSLKNESSRSYLECDIDNLASKLVDCLNNEISYHEKIANKDEPMTTEVNELDKLDSIESKTDKVVIALTS